MAHFWFHTHGYESFEISSFQCFHCISSCIIVNKKPHTKRCAKKLLFFFFQFKRNSFASLWRKITNKTTTKICIGCARFRCCRCYMDECRSHYYGYWTDFAMRCCCCCWYCFVITAVSFTLLLSSQNHVVWENRPFLLDNNILLYLIKHILVNCIVICVPCKINTVIIYY